MKVKLIVEGGNMKPGPAVSQQLGPAGINLGKVIQDVNEATSEFKGTKVPVELNVDTGTKEFTVQVFSPPTSELIKKEAKLEKASGTSGKIVAGNIAIEQAISVAKAKMSDMLAKDLKAAVRLVIGSCVSLGIMIESKDPRQVQDEIIEGKYDNEISQERTEVSPEKKEALDKVFSEIKAKQEEDAKVAEAAKVAEEAAKAEATPEATPGDKKTPEKKEEPKKK